MTSNNSLKILLLMSILASDILFIVSNSNDVNQKLHTWNEYDKTESDRKVYYRLNAFHYQFCKD